MSFIKRAYLAVVKRRTKSILMFAVLFVIGTMILAGFAIKKATDNAAELAKEKLGGTITISYDYQSAMQKARESETSSSSTSSTDDRRMVMVNATPISEDSLTSIVTLKGISSYNYLISGTANASGFTAIENTSSYANNDNKSTTYTNTSDSSRSAMKQGDITVKGVISSKDSNIGDITLKDGKQITKDDIGKNVIMIEKNLAEANNLSVGDTISLTATYSGDTIAFKIVGIYEASSSSNEMDQSRTYNTVYMPYDIASKYFRQASYNIDTSTTTYTEGIDKVYLTLEDPDDYKSVKAAIIATGKIDTDTYTVDINTELYSQMTEPIQNVGQFAQTAVIVIVVAGIIILTLMLLLFIKERMNEVGILLSLGESKLKIGLQFITEAIIIGLFAFTLSIGSGAMISNVIANKLLSTELTESKSTGTESKFSGMGDNSSKGISGGINSMLSNPTRTYSNVSYISELDVSITASEILELYGVGILIILVGIAIPMLSVSRFSPRRILNNEF